jgi:hypothetical protein
MTPFRVEDDDDDDDDEVVMKKKKDGASRRRIIHCIHISHLSWRSLALLHCTRKKSTAHL